MSLWTPSGEHPVGDQPPRGAAPPPPSQPPGHSPGPGGPGSGAPGGPGLGAPGAEPGDHGGPAVDMDELRRQLADAPAEVVVANHCYGLFELAAVYLSQSPPLLPQARLAIDALGYLVGGLGDRLGEVHGSLQEALAQVRLAFVELNAADQARQDTANGSARD